nr:hypothetical protein [Salipiger thiooxidans]
MFARPAANANLFRHRAQVADRHGQVALVEFRHQDLAPRVKEMPRGEADRALVDVALQRILRHEPALNQQGLAAQLGAAEQAFGAAAQQVEMRPDRRLGHQDLFDMGRRDDAPLRAHLRTALPPENWTI